MTQMHHCPVSMPVSGHLPDPTSPNPPTWPAEPTGRGFITLLEGFRATGGTAPGGVVGRLLAQHQAGRVVALDELLRSGQVFGFEWRESLWIPMFQFDAGDLGLKAAAQRVRAELPSLWSKWALASWFAGPNEQLGRRSPADMIDSDLDAVLRAALSLRSVREFSLPLRRRASDVQRAPVKLDPFAHAPAAAVASVTPKPKPSFLKRADHSTVAA